VWSRKKVNEPDGGRGEHLLERKTKVKRTKREKIQQGAPKPHFTVQKLRRHGKLPKEKKKPPPYLKVGLVRAGAFWES